MPSVTSVKNRLTIQMRKYSPALPLNSGRTTRIACAPADGSLATFSMLPPGPAGASRCAALRRADYPSNETPRGFLPGAPFPYLCFSQRSNSGTPAPQPAIAPRHELQVVLVARPFLVLRQLHFLLGRLPALAFARRDLHGLGRVLEES